MRAGAWIVRQSGLLRTPIRQLKSILRWAFCFAIMALMYRDRRQPIDKGIPALVCVRTDEKVVINGKSYTVLKLMYDLKAEYMPYATFNLH